MFITFEGQDGSGKTTTIKLLSKFLNENNIDYILTREPGSPHSKESEQIRKILISKENVIPPITESLLFAADRRMHLDNIILPALEAGKIVICDRYIDSSLAYQGEGRQIGIEDVKTINEIATQGKYPDITIFLDVTLENSLKRVDLRAPKDRFELANDDFRKRVHIGYQKIAKMFPKRYRIIDANKNIDKVFEEIKKIFKEEVINL